LTVATLAKKS